MSDGFFSCTIIVFSVFTIKQVMTTLRCMHFCDLGYFLMDFPFILREKKYIHKNVTVEFLKKSLISVI